MQLGWGIARSKKFRTELQRDHEHVGKPTGIDDPAHNGGVELWNGTFTVTVRTLLYGAGWLAVYWSAALVHTVSLYNHRMHSATQATTYKVWYGTRPNIGRLWMFGA